MCSLFTKAISVLLVNPREKFPELVHLIHLLERWVSLHGVGERIEQRPTRSLPVFRKGWFSVLFVHGSDP